MNISKKFLNKLGRPFGVNPFPVAFNYEGSADSDASARFNDIYTNNYWGSQYTASGPGSEETFVFKYREQLDRTLIKLRLSRIFDSPCGDVSWISKLLVANKYSYIGGDISDKLIESAKESYPNLDLRVFDITSTCFPDADVWHCRDCLFHLPFSAIKDAFKNFLNSNIRYAFITTHKSLFLHENLDINTGGFRYLDLERQPICLPRARVYLPDFIRWRDFPRYVGVWSKADISESLSRWA